MDFRKNRWDGIIRPYSREEVERLTPRLPIGNPWANAAAELAWEYIQTRDYVYALGCMTGGQAKQCALAGLDVGYCSGWQVAADGNIDCDVLPDQSMYSSGSVPVMMERINNALMRADMIERAEGRQTRNWLVPYFADAEAGYGGRKHSFNLMMKMIRKGAAGVHFEDQVSSEKKCGHLGGKVLVPARTFIQSLIGARIAADVMGSSTILIARTDANSAKLVDKVCDDVDKRFLTGEVINGGEFYGITGGIDHAITRALAYAPYADMLWCETGTPDVEEARYFAKAIHEKFPGKPLAYNCSPSFPWEKHLSKAQIATFQKDLAALGYKYQFVTLAGWHALNYSMYDLALDYKERGMSAYSDLQQREFALAKSGGYTAAKHQREVGNDYYDLLDDVITRGQSSTKAMKGSTEEGFDH